MSTTTPKELVREARRRLAKGSGLNDPDLLVLIDESEKLLAAARVLQPLLRQLETEMGNIFRDAADEKAPRDAAPQAEAAKPTAADEKGVQDVPAAKSPAPPPSGVVAAVVKNL